MSFLGKGGALFKRHRNTAFPATLTFGGLTLRVESKAHLQGLCADQNLYLITPHHGQLTGGEERKMAAGRYPRVTAYGGD